MNTKDVMRVTPTTDLAVITEQQPQGLLLCQFEDPKQLGRVMVYLQALNYLPPYESRKVWQQNLEQQPRLGVKLYRPELLLQDYNYQAADIPAFSCGTIPQVPVLAIKEKGDLLAYITPYSHNNYILKSTGQEQLFYRSLQYGESGVVPLSVLHYLLRSDNIDFMLKMDFVHNVHVITKSDLGLIRCTNRKQEQGLTWSDGTQLPVPEFLSYLRQVILNSAAMPYYGYYPLYNLLSNIGYSELALHKGVPQAFYYMAKTASNTYSLLFYAETKLDLVLRSALLHRVLQVAKTLGAQYVNLGIVPPKSNNVIEARAANMLNTYAILLGIRS